MTVRRHFFTPVGRQAVHENRVAIGGGHEIRVHLVGREDSTTLDGLCLFAHRRPDIRVDGIDPVDRAPWIREASDRSAIPATCGAVFTTLSGS